MIGRDRVNGLTLVELLVAIAMVAILAAIIVSIVHTNPIRGKSVHCISNLRHLGLALVSYACEYESYPDSDGNGPDLGQQLINDLRLLGPPAPGRAILQGQDVLFVCPRAGVSPSPTAVTYRGPNYALDDDVESDRPVMCDADPHQGEVEVNVLYKGTNVQSVDVNTKDYEVAKKWCP